MLNVIERILFGFIALWVGLHRMVPPSIVGLLEMIPLINIAFFYKITIAKFICLTLLFSFLWGIWWFDTAVGPGHGILLMTWAKFLLSSIPVGAVYTLVLFVSIVGFVVVPFIRPRTIRVPLMVIMLVGWTLELIVLDLNGGLSSQNLFWLMWKEQATAAEAIYGYAPYIIRNSAIVAILGIVLCAAPDRRFSLPGSFGFLTIIAGVMVAGVTVYTKGGTQSFSIPFSTVSNAAIVLAKATGNPDSMPRFWDPALLGETFKSSDVAVDKPVQPVFEKVVMIMDESVRGDYLSINNARRNTTPFLESASYLSNFGVAVSAGNCSHISRTILRFGMRQSDLPHNWRSGLKRPSIWHFAQAAGYKTVYMDAWGSSPEHGVLAPNEEARIDLRIPINEKADHLRDKKLAIKLNQLIKEEGPAFIYVSKYGTHLPYSTKYPPYFQVSPRQADSSSGGYEAAAVWSREIDAFLRSFLPPFDYEIAEYPKAIAWSVDEFFRTLLHQVDLSRTLLLYTSDHGQSLLPGRFSHCSSRAPIPPEEAYVPLFAVTSMSAYERRLKSSATRGFNRFSHFEIFPTLLLAMGFNPEWVRQIYGSSLLDPPSSKREFMAGSPTFHPMMVSVGQLSTTETRDADE